jgi:hypothetical protein
VTRSAMPSRPRHPPHGPRPSAYGSQAHRDGAAAASHSLVRPATRPRSSRFDRNTLTGTRDARLCFLSAPTAFATTAVVIAAFQAAYDSGDHEQGCPLN